MIPRHGECRFLLKIRSASRCSHEVTTAAKPPALVAQTALCQSSSSSQGPCSMAGIADLELNLDTGQSNASQLARCLVIEERSNRKQLVETSLRAKGKLKEV